MWFIYTVAGFHGYIYFLGLAYHSFLNFVSVIYKVAIIYRTLKHRDITY